MTTSLTARSLTRKLLALCCAVLTVLLLSAQLSPADARRGGGGGGGRGFSHHGGGSKHFHGGGRHHGGSRFHSGRHHSGHRFYPRYWGGYVGAPFIYYGSDYYYADCNWLRRRALRTGNPYWWDRYYACIGD